MAAPVGKAVLHYFGAIKDCDSDRWWGGHAIQS